MVSAFNGGQETTVDSSRHTLLKTENEFISLAPYGNIDIRYNVYKVDEANKSSLFLISGGVNFTPGVVPLNIGNQEYGEYWPKVGFVNVGVEQNTEYIYFPMDGYEEYYGGKPIYKEHFPLSSPSTVQISSSYSSSVTFGVSAEVGYSTNKGFGGSISSSMSTTISYQKGYSLTDSEPSLSSQRASTDVSQWSFIYNSFPEKGSKTGLRMNKSYYQDFNVFFEMNNLNIPHNTITTSNNVRNQLGNSFNMEIGYGFTVEKGNYKEGHYLPSHTTTLVGKKAITLEPTAHIAKPTLWEQHPNGYTYFTFGASLDDFDFPKGIHIGLEMYDIEHGVCYGRNPLFPRLPEWDTSVYREFPLPASVSAMEYKIIMGIGCASATGTLTTCGWRFTRALI